MIYRGVVYFLGPKTGWSGKVVESEVIFRTEGRWLWIVRLQTMGAYGPLDRSKCGYAISCDDMLLEHAEATP